MNVIKELEDMFKSVFLSDASLVGRLLLTLSAFIIIFSLRYIINKSVLPRLKMYLANAWRKNFSYVSWGLFLLLITIIWLPHLRGFFTLFGIIGTGILIVTKEVIINLLGWFYITVRRPFEIGNRIMIDNFTGDVTDIRLLEFSMIEVKPGSEGGQSTGRILRIPNGMLFTRVLANSSKEFSLYWNEVQIPVSAKSNWKKALKIIEQLSKKKILQVLPDDPRLRKAQSRHSIFYKRTEPKIYTEFRGGAVIFTLRHLSTPKRIRDVNDAIWKELLDEFARHKDIDLFVP